MLIIKVLTHKFNQNKISDLSYWSVRVFNGKLTFILQCTQKHVFLYIRGRLFFLQSLVLFISSKFV